jgi:hypothetical protein
MFHVLISGKKKESKEPSNSAEPTVEGALARKIAVSRRVRRKGTSVVCRIWASSFFTFCLGVVLGCESE